jgi:hypothetical protein
VYIQPRSATFQSQVVVNSEPIRPDPWRRPSQATGGDAERLDSGSQNTLKP